MIYGCVLCTHEEMKERLQKMRQSGIPAGCIYADVRLEKTFATTPTNRLAYLPAGRS